MKTALLGGTFNPPHASHILMAQHAVEELGFDRVLVIPTADPPHKPVVGGATPQQRLDMAHLAFRDCAQAEVSDVEIRRAGKSYTYDTVHQLQEEVPYEYYHLLLGQDMLAAIESWHRYEELLQEISIVVYPRQGEESDLAALVERLTERYNADIEVAEVSLPGFSSTALRDEMAALLPLGLPAAVTRYIIDQGLYDVRLDESRAANEQERGIIGQLRGWLSPKRLYHSIAVMEEMQRLAQRYGADVPRARLAGLLHDCTKDASYEQQLQLCEQYGIALTELERSSPKLLHAMTGAARAGELLGAGHDDIVAAIRTHTTGRADMALLQQLLYMADYIEPLRDFAGVEEVRAIAYVDLKAALLLALDQTVVELLEKKSLLHPDTLEARNDMLLRSMPE